MTKECSKKIAREICRKKWGTKWYDHDKKNRLRIARDMYCGSAKQPARKATLCATPDAEPAWPMTTLVHYDESVHGLPSGHLVVNNDTIYHQPELQTRWNSPLPALETALRENCCRFNTRKIHVIHETWQAMSVADRDLACQLKCPNCKKQVETVYTRARVPGESVPM